MDTEFAVVLFENVLGSVNLYLNVADLNVKAASPFYIIYVLFFFHLNTEQNSSDMTLQDLKMKVKKLGYIKITVPSRTFLASQHVTNDKVTGGMFLKQQRCRDRLSRFR